jgi:manganese/zinc/iron transport system substrate-binding protein
MKRRLLLLLPGLLLPLLAGCERRTEAGIVTGRKVRAVGTTGMVAEIVREVGGGRVEPAALMDAGVDPHLYKPSQGDVARMVDADVIFYNGLQLEGKMGEVLHRLAEGGSASGQGYGRLTVPVAEAIDESLLLHPPEFEGHYDPHVWFDVSLWARTVAPVVAALSRLQPDGREEFEENGAAYRERLLALHDYCRERMALIPRERRVLVTAHDAFGYFGRAYETEVVGLQGISTLTEAGLGDIREKVELLVRRNVGAVFVESSVSDRALQAVIAGCRARGHEVRIGGTLFSDAMGDPGTPEGTYEGMVRHNVETIVAALR